MKTKITAKELLEKTGRKLYIDYDVLETCPEPKRVTELQFFTLGKYVSDDDLEKEYESRGLVPAPVKAIAAYDLENRADMDGKKYLGTHWKDSEGRWCFATFRQWSDDERFVYVIRSDVDWDDYWWFAGFRKSALSTSEPKTSSDPLPFELRAKTAEAKLEAIRKIVNE